MKFFAHSVCLVFQIVVILAWAFPQILESYCNGFSENYFTCLCQEFSFYANNSQKQSSYGVIKILHIPLTHLLSLTESFNWSTLSWCSDSPSSPSSIRLLRFFIQFCIYLLNFSNPIISIWFIFQYFYLFTEYFYISYIEFLISFSYLFSYNLFISPFISSFIFLKIL